MSDNSGARIDLSCTLNKYFLYLFPMAAYCLDYHGWQASFFIVFRTLPVEMLLIVIRVH